MNGESMGWRTLSSIISTWIFVIFVIAQYGSHGSSVTHHHLVDGALIFSGIDLAVFLFFAISRGG